MSLSHSLRSRLTDHDVRSSRIRFLAYVDLCGVTYAVSRLLQPPRHLHRPAPTRSHPSLPELEQPHRLMNTTTATTRTPFVYVGSVDQASDFPSRMCLLTWNFQMNLEHSVPPDTTQAPEASMPLSPLLIASRHHTNVLYIAPDLPA